jgi:hypothetical protein
MRSWTRLALALLARALFNPLVAWNLWTMAWAMRRRDWYKRPPFLPLPPGEYVRWRMYTAYGDEDAIPSVRDVLRFARWRREITRV